MKNMNDAYIATIAPIGENYVTALCDALAAKLQEREPAVYPTRESALQRITEIIAVRVSPCYDD
jgi:hypothetical protein